MLATLFGILAILMALEASTPLARTGGYAINDPASGLIFQSSLSLLSRLLMFMFMPLLGLSADLGLLDTENNIVFIYLLVPIAIFLVYHFSSKIMSTYTRIIISISINGSLFGRILNDQTQILISQKQLTSRSNIGRRFVIFRKLKRLYILTALAFIPYYLAWPVSILLMEWHPDMRATLLSVSTILNGINTIIITVFIDPKLAQIGRRRRVVYHVYLDSILVRLLSSVIAIFPFLFLI